jgi:hypothetical protein
LRGGLFVAGGLRCVCTRTHVQPHTDIDTCTRTHIYTYTRTRARAHTHTNTHTHTHRPVEMWMKDENPFAFLLQDAQESGQEERGGDE